MTTRTSVFADLGHNRVTGFPTVKKKPNVYEIELENYCAYLTLAIQCQKEDKDKPKPKPKPKTITDIIKDMPELGKTKKGGDNKWNINFDNIVPQ